MQRAPHERAEEGQIPEVGQPTNEYDAAHVEPLEQQLERRREGGRENNRGRVVRRHACGDSGIRELHHDFARLKKETKEAGKELVSSTVIGAPLHTLAQLAGLKKINFLSIDVEGAEVAILKAFDFKALPVDVVMVECSYRAEQLQGLMDQKGFLRQARAHGDYVFLSRRATGVCGAPAPTRGGRPPGVARTYTRPEPKEVEEIDF